MNLGHNTHTHTHRDSYTGHTLMFVLPVCMMGVYRHGFAAKVLASVEMPDHRDLPQHHPALRHREAAGGSEKV